MPNVLTLTEAAALAATGVVDCAAACILQIISLPAKIFLAVPSREPITAQNTVVCSLSLWIFSQNNLIFLIKINIASLILVRLLIPSSSSACWATAAKTRWIQ